VAKQRVSPRPPHPKAGLVRVPSLPRTAHALKQSRRTRPLALRKSAPLPLQQGLYIVFFVGATSLQLPHVTRWPLRVHLMGYPAAGGVHVVYCVHLVSGAARNWSCTFALRKCALFSFEQGLYIVLFVRLTSLQLLHVTRWPLRVHLMAYPAAGGVHVVHCAHLVSGPPIVEAIGFQHLSGRALPPIERRWVRR